MSYQKLHVDSVVRARDQTWIILSAVDATHLAVRSQKTGEKALLAVAELDLSEDVQTGYSEPSSLISDARWTKADRKMEILEPLLELPNRTRQDVEDHALKYNMHPATLYRWLDQWNENPEVRGLVEDRRGPDPDGTRIWTEEVVGAFDVLLQAKYLTEQPITAKAFHRKFRMALNKLGLKSPSESSTLRRLDLVPGLLKSRRQGDKRGEEKFSATPGKSPLGKRIQSDYQIDHTPLSIVCVDRVKRLPIGRPYLTLVIDVKSRMIVGIYVSLDPPCTTSVALAVANTIAPKEAYLNRAGVKGVWPVWGPPQSLHADNAGEFRTEAVRLGCSRHNSKMQWRPVKTPRYGAHIEALIGSTEEMIRELPGALFHKPEARGSYDSNKEAAFTVEELEQVIVHWAVNIYSVRPHSGLGGRTPLGVWNEGIVGNPPEVMGIGLPSRPTRPELIHIDFLPIHYRLVHSVGIVIDNVAYFCDELRSFVGEKNRWGKERNSEKHELRKNSHKYETRQDDRAISPILFLNPRTGEYIKVPYADPTRKVISRWELDAAARHLKKIGAKEWDEATLFKAHDELEEMAKRSQQTTKTRRAEERKKKNADLAVSSQSDPSVPAATPLRHEVAAVEMTPAKKSLPILVDIDDVEAL